MPGAYKSSSLSSIMKKKDQNYRWRLCWVRKARMICGGCGVSGASWCCGWRSQDASSSCGCASWTWSARCTTDPSRTSYRWCAGRSQGPPSAWSTSRPQPSARARCECTGSHWSGRKSHSATIHSTTCLLHFLATVRFRWYSLTLALMLLLVTSPGMLNSTLRSVMHWWTRCLMTPVQSGTPGLHQRRPVWLWWQYSGPTCLLWSGRWRRREWCLLPGSGSLFPRQSEPQIPWHSRLTSRGLLS